MPPIFEWLQRTGNISDAEMLKTFNCGVGMVLVVDSDSAQAIVATLAEASENAWIIGTITAAEGEAVVQYHGAD